MKFTAILFVVVAVLLSAVYAEHLNVGQKLNDRFKIASFIGKGAGGEAYFAKDLHLKSEVVVKLLMNIELYDFPGCDRLGSVKSKIDCIKQLYRTPFSDPSGDAYLRYEAWVLKHFTGHPRVVQLVDTFPVDVQGQSYYVLVLEKMDGSVDKLLNDKKMTDKTRQIIAHEMVEALKVIHDHGFGHLDVKLGNFLYRMTKGKKYQIKIADFDTATPFSLVPYTKGAATDNGVHPLCADQTAAKAAFKNFAVDNTMGTAQYKPKSLALCPNTAPEVPTSWDSFSMAITLVEWLKRVDLKTTTQSQVRKMITDDIFSGDTVVNQIVRRCMAKDPLARCTSWETITGLGSEGMGFCTDGASNPIVGLKNKEPKLRKANNGHRGGERDQTNNNDQQNDNADQNDNTGSDSDNDDTNTNNAVLIPNNAATRPDRKAFITSRQARKGHIVGRTATVFGQDKEDPDLTDI